MDAYDRRTNLEKKILLLVLSSMVETEKFSDQPHTILSLSVIKISLPNYLKHKLNQASFYFHL
jgi:hypothetical protein